MAKMKSHLTTSQAAVLLGVDKYTALVWCRSGRLRAWTTPGGHYRVPISEIERMTAGVVTRGITPEGEVLVWEARPATAGR